MPPRVEGMDWDGEFVPMFSRRWEPGQHVAIVAPTNSGKTTVLCGILPDRKFALALDPKGGDTTLSSLGWPRLTSWPLSHAQHDRMAEGKPARYIVGNRVRTRDDMRRLRELHRRVLNGVFDEGGWTVAIDEFQILADRRMMALGSEAETLLISARDKGVSVVTLFQAPRWVPRAASDQSSWIFVALTLDTDVVNRVAEMLGRPKPEIRGAIEGLGSRKYAWLVASNNPRDPLIVTVPRKAVRRTQPA